MPSLLDVKSLSISFEPTPGLVLNDISFSLSEGGRIAIVGPSGCGKTTLLRALSGSLSNSISGMIRWATEVTQPVPIVWQDIRLFPWLTVLGNVQYVLELSEQSASDRKTAMEVLCTVGMGWAADMWPNRLSRGQSQRVALARCLATGSKVILLDEPFASLDGISRRRMGNFLLKLASSENLSYILVTHDSREAMGLAERIIVLTSRPARIELELAREAGQFDEETEERIWRLLESFSDNLLDDSF